jgi:hypothetical protein
MCKHVYSLQGHSKVQSDIAFPVQLEQTVMVWALLGKTVSSQNLCMVASKTTRPETLPHYLIQLSNYI